MPTVFSGMEDAWEKFTTGGELSFSNLTRSVISDLARIAFRQSAISRPYHPGASRRTHGTGGTATGTWRSRRPEGRTPQPRWKQRHSETGHAVPGRWKRAEADHHQHRRRKLDGGEPGASGKSRYRWDESIQGKELRGIPAFLLSGDTLLTRAKVPGQTYRRRSRLPGRIRYLPHVFRHYLRRKRERHKEGKNRQTQHDLLQPCTYSRRQP